ncbi:hypothetical protein ACJRO7_029510 [Eucalyptus globulus]|uniref:Uncharacterized protein n=1 Tax=Eucalyptus globulus TaxID=34317 RepID=A0ABD3JAS9_EUCGL
MIPCVPLVLKATIELGILKLLSKSYAQLSPTQIASRLSIKNPDAAVTIDRILRLLASCSFLSCTLTQDKAERPERMYGLGPLSKYYVSEQGATMASWLLLLLDEVSLRTCMSTIFMGKFMDTHCRFKNAKMVVHVGGAVGECLELILSKHPDLRGINFDLPHVVKNGLSYPLLMAGLEHVGGSFVDDPIPKGDTLLTKWQFHSCTDEFVIQLLKKCWNALPASGKVVIIDPVSPEYPGTDLVTRATFTSDMVMLALPPGGKDRTLREVEVVARATGFSSPKVGCQVLHMWALELYKTA